jgi:glucokinase
VSLTVGVDVGGTKIAAGVVGDDGTLVASTRRDSPAQQPAAIADGIADVVTELRGAHDVAAVGLAAAGYLDRAGTRIMFAPNLAWRDERLRDLVEDRVGLPTVLENDANCAAWAEHRFGAAQDARTLVMATIGTGIGGGMVHDGELFRGGFGVGAEFGHMRVVPDGRACACGLLGCWEAYGSGTALAARARELATQDPASARVLLELAGDDLASIRGVLVSEAAGRGDPASLESFAELARWIGEGFASLAAVLDPDVIVVGGGVSESSQLDLDAIRAAFDSAETGFGHRPEPAIRRAQLGNRAGLIGAADLARARL